MTVPVETFTKIVRAFLVASALSPILLLWAIKGTGAVPHSYWATGCIVVFFLINVCLYINFKDYKRNSVEEFVRPINIRDGRESAVTYCLSMFIPFFDANASNVYELFAVLAALLFFVVIFYKLSIFYFNPVFLLLGFKVFLVEENGVRGSVITKVVLTKNLVPKVGVELKSIKAASGVVVAVE